MQDWHFEYFGAAPRKPASDQLSGTDALIMGRKTYDGFSAAWPERAGTDDFVDRMNSIQKYVISSTLKDPTWTNSRSSTATSRPRCAR